MSNEELARVISQTSSSTAMVGGGASVLKHQDSEDTEAGMVPPSVPVVLGENSFLNKNEQIALFMNLAIPGIVPVPRGLSSETNPRVAPPEYFTVRRYKPVTYATTTTLAQAASGGQTKLVKQITSKFQIINSDVYIVGAAIPIRLDPG